MKIISKNLKTGSICLRTQSQDDVWLIYRIVQPKDLAGANTERKIKVGNASSEKASAVSIKKMFLTISVEKTSYEPTTKSTRLLGPITQGNEYVSAGEHHSFSIDEDFEITITKSNWPNYVLKLLEEAASGGKGNTLIVAFDRENAMIGSFSARGFTKIASIEGTVQKKGMDQQAKSSFYEEIVNKIIEIQQRVKPTNIVLASSDFWKNSLFNAIDFLAPTLRKITKWIECDDVSQTAINQLVKTPEFQKITLGQIQKSIYETFEECMKRISTDAAATYGFKDVKKAVDMSAVNTLLVSTNFLSKMREKDEFEKIESVLCAAEATGSIVHIVGDEFTIIDKLDGLGGIVALLRFKQA